MFNKTVSLLTFLFFFQVNFCFGENENLAWMSLLLLNNDPPGRVISVGQTWLDRNLGASRVATGMDDEAAYGDLYQWGRGKDGHQRRTSGTTPNLSDSDTPGHGDFITVAIGPWDWRSTPNDTLWQAATGINNPCPAGFRLPTAAEWETERVSWDTNDRAGAYNSPLKLVLAGGRGIGDGALNLGGINGLYWSSTTEDGSYSSAVFFDTDAAGINPNPRANGLSVRCFED